MKNPGSHLKKLISMMPFEFGVTAILMLLSLNVYGQTAKPERMSPVKISSAQLLHSAKVYFRDTVELPLLEVTTLSISDSSGRMRKTKPGSSPVTFGGFHISNGEAEVPSLSDSSSRANKTGPDPGTSPSQGERMQDKNEYQFPIKLNMSWWARIWIRKRSLFWVNSNIWTMVPGVIFTALSGNPETYVLNASSADDQSGLVMVKLTPAKTCPAFNINNQPVPYFPDGFCGIAEFQLGDDLIFQKFAFEAPGLPISTKVDRLGQCILRRYHVQIEFQKVTLPGSRDPFLVPKQVMTTLETDKGSIVIASTYEPQQSTE